MRGSDENHDAVARRRSRFWTLCTTALLTVVFITSAFIVMQDNLPLRDDPTSNLISSVTLRRALEGQPPHMDWRRWIDSTTWRPPLPAIINLPALLLFDDQILAIRMTETLVFMLALWLVFRIGCRLASPRAGFLATFLVAAFPVVQGWSRMGNADPVIMLTLLLLLYTLIDLDLRSPAQAILLGLTVGLCASTRFLSFVFLVGPLVHVLVMKVRDRRSAINLAAAAVWALNVGGWWYVHKVSYVARNVQMSTQQLQQRLPEEFSSLNYIFDGYALVLLCAIVAGVYIHRRRLLAPDNLFMFACWIGLGGLQLAFVWDYFARYPTFLLPHCALLIAIAFDRWIATATGLRRRISWGVAIAAGLIPLAAYLGEGNTSDPDSMNRSRWGLMTPETRKFDGISRALRRVPVGGQVLLIDEQDSDGFVLARHCANRNPAQELHTAPDPSDPHAFLPDTEVRYALRVTSRSGPGSATSSEWSALLRRLRARRVAATTDDAGLDYHLYEFPGHLRADMLKF